MSFPTTIEKYYEPFIGGGAVFFGYDWSKETYLNDKSEDLMRLYTCIKNKNRLFIKTLQHINIIWKDIANFVLFNIDILKNYYKSNQYNSRQELKKFIMNTKLFDDISQLVHTLEKKYMVKIFSDCVFDKFGRTRKIENARGKLQQNSDYCDNIESGFKRGLYTILRKIYNETKVFNGFSSALFFFIREYCYSSMFRYNSRGDFNVPYGGISYNHKYLDEKISYITSKNMTTKLSSAVISCTDFYDFLKNYPPQMNDFVFLDPPYDTEFSCYAKNEFTHKDHERLAHYLKNECLGNWMLVIKKTDFIKALYPLHKETVNGGNIYFFDFSKKYQVSFKNRNSKDSTHCIITNYDVNRWTR